MQLPLIVLLAALSFALVGLGAQAGSSNAIDEPISQEAAISGDPDKPRRHFRVRDPARLEPAAATTIYRDLADDLADIYALSGDKASAGYQKWRRYNTSPYLSVTHGQRYVNNYANDLASDYGRYEHSGVLPGGGIIAKDSLAVTRDGGVFPGPMFLMEKMAPGFSNATGDWRYTMIMPDGSLFGVTKGKNSERVEYCIGCHLARERFDHLYYPPRKFRASP